MQVVIFVTIQLISEEAVFVTNFVDTDSSNRSKIDEAGAGARARARADDPNSDFLQYGYLKTSTLDIEGIEMVEAHWSPPC